MECLPEDQATKGTPEFMTQQYAAAVEAVTGVGDPGYVDFMARRLVEMAGYIVMGYLLLEDTTRCADFRRSLEVFVKYGQAEVAKHADFIANSPLISSPTILSDYWFATIEILGADKYWIKNLRTDNKESGGLPCATSRRTLYVS